MKNIQKALFLSIFIASVLFFTSHKTASAQSGRFAEPVFEDVIVEEEIPFSRAVREGMLLPTTLYFDFYEPEGDTMQARPLVITMFGGAFVTGWRDFADMTEYCTRLAKHGYVTATIDYRLLPIVYLSERSIIREAYMSAQDLSAAIRYFKANCEEYRIDPSRIFVLGSSSSSISILLELFMDDDERPAETFEYPDLGPMHSSGFEEYADYSAQVSGAIPQWGGIIGTDMIDADDYTPLCMIHGTNDVTLPYDTGYCSSQLLLNSISIYMYGSHAIANRLDDLGITDYELHTFEGKGHVFYFNAIMMIKEAEFDTCFNITRNFLLNHLAMPTSIGETLAENISIYPNPASEYIIIGNEDESSPMPLNVDVFDMTGRKVMSGSVYGTRQTIEVSQWQAGIYIVRFERDGRSVNRKITIIH